MTTELISIICTVKNGENTISNTIESVINQTFTNWELVIVDDGSNDGTVSILNRYKDRDNRVKLVLTDAIGRGKALNLAIENASGKYICNLDADDLMHPQKLSIQYKIITENPNYFLISTNSEIIHGNGTPLWKEYSKDSSFLKRINHSILIGNQINHSSVIMNKVLLQELGGYDEGRSTQFDYELWLRAFINNKEMGIINNVLTAKRIHNSQSFENKRRIKYLYNSMILQIRSISLYKKQLLLIVIPPIRFILGLLPFKFRRLINIIISLF
ncbi:glycosyltransferase [Sutcliffiella horikoshii]|uniref:glycosyltransferase family 2 protein n=1 Tax=Sutcliffiella horikoshii TaxID=79883 RepID=UPI00384B6C44